VEIVRQYHHDPSLAAAQLALKRVNPSAPFSIFISFKIPLFSKSTPKAMPMLLQDAVKRLLSKHFNSSGIIEIASSFDKCSWIDSTSFFDNTVSMLCTSHNRLLSITSLSHTRRDWISKEKIASKVIFERLALIKHEDSKTMWNYDPVKYVYDVSDKSYSSVWNVISTVESLVEPGEFDLSSSGDLQISSVALPLTSKLLPANIEHSLTKQGMHRELIITSNHKAISPPTTTISCRIVAIELLSDAFFVDQYEVEELSRFGGGPNITIYRDIDLEKPSYLSPTNIVVVSSPVSWESTSIRLSLPIHHRYQTPSINTPYTDVFIHNPTILTYCAPGRFTPAPPESSIISSLLIGSYPTSLPNGHALYIHHATRPAAPIHTLWPNGVWEDGKTVATYTALIAFAMSFVTIQAILMKWKKERKAASMQASNVATGSLQKK
jgi:hypothetical protein